MAKKSTKTAVKAEQTTTYSTRLSDEEKRILEEAATLADMSSSKFIRNATLKASVEKINAASPNDLAIKTIARVLAKQLLDNQLEINYHGEHEHFETSRTVVLQSDTNIDLEYPCDGEQYPHFHPHSITPRIMSRLQINRLIKVAQNCPQTFVESLVHELQGRVDDIPEFTPRVDMGSIAED